MFKEYLRTMFPLTFIWRINKLKNTIKDFWKIPMEANQVFIDNLSEQKPWDADKKPAQNETKKNS